MAAVKLIYDSAIFLFKDDRFKLNWTAYTFNVCISSPALKKRKGWQGGGGAKN